jgi:hypothetical protein
MGPDGSGYQMPRTPDNTYLALGATRGNHDGGMAALLEAAREESQSPCREDPHTLEYLGTYVKERCTWNPKRTKKLGLFVGVYWTLRVMAKAGNQPRVMRIIQLHPSADWERIWINLHECWMTEADKVTWYMVIHDILPTNELLQKIRLVASPLSRQCG